MNFKDKVITGMKKSTTALALTVILGQTMFPAMEVFADDSVTNISTEETVEQLSTEEESTESTLDPKVLEIINDSLLTEEGKAMKMYSVFEGMSKVSYGYTTEAGEEVTVQEQANPLSQMVLDMSEYTSYTFRVDLNGYWAEGQMPVLRDAATREVLFCIEPGVAAIAGPGYTPADLTPQQRMWFENIGNFGYPMEQSHEMYFTSQGYMWEKMGSTFSGSYGGYTAKKAQIDANIAAYYTRPSFDEQKVTVKMGEPLTLTDTNGVLEEYVRDFSTGGLIISRNGNNLTLTVTEDTEDTAFVELWKVNQVGMSIAYIQDGAQMLGKFTVSDPAATTLEVEAIKTGKVRIGKQDEVTGKYLPNTSYEGSIGDEQVAFTTGADGHHELPKEYIHGTPFSFVETDVPEGYVLDTTPITGTIVGGQTITLVQQNTHQLADITFEKEHEVFDAEETTLQGTPVYKDIPLEGAEFTNTNSNDTTAPDQETVVTPAGEYLDTMVTDEEGKGKSTVPFTNGAQNEYILDEINEPDNYRQFEPVKFSVDYDVSTVEIATYDFGLIRNELKTGEVDFNKKDDMDLNSLFNIAGAEIHVEGISENTRDVDFVFTTGITTENLKLKEGRYRFSEVGYPDGFTLSPNQPHSMIVTVVDKQKVTIDWENTKKPIDEPKTPEVPNTPVTIPTANTPARQGTGSLPNTGEESLTWLSVLGMTIVLSGSAAYIVLKRKEKHEA